MTNPTTQTLQWKKFLKSARQYDWSIQTNENNTKIVVTSEHKTAKHKIKILKKRHNSIKYPFHKKNSKTRYLTKKSISITSTVCHRYHTPVIDWLMLQKIVRLMIDQSEPKGRSQQLSVHKAKHAKNKDRLVEIFSLQDKTVWSAEMILPRLMSFTYYQPTSSW